MNFKIIAFQLKLEINKKKTILLQVLEQHTNKAYPTDPSYHPLILHLLAPIITVCVIQTCMKYVQPCVGLHKYIRIYK